ncbi:hypothetical protein K435DRAFT_863925 [Dendrothele bispora CBS 962.96]|uniref:Uncharacterized protein n=1 Tax=Dendrothele bispora (strain CBS 962.96) TaxID=1314807 RepID=A0A4S8LP60_DENBC|nr:hypothetical protein K435DRAFT_863925 [Dendrothele bispora CBS 962.96]
MSSSVTFESELGTSLGITEEISQCTIPELPSELEREIFELAARTHKGTALNLALVSRRTQIWMERLLYQSIVLDSTDQLRHFLRTVAVRPPSFFAEYVKRLYLTTFVDLDTALQLLSVCTGITHLTSWAGPETPTLKEQLPVNCHTPPASLLSALSLRSTNSFSSLQRMSIKLEALVINIIRPAVSHTSPLSSPPAFSNITNTLPSPHGNTSNVNSSNGSGSITSRFPATPPPTIDFSHPVFSQLTHLDVVCPPFCSLTTFRSMFSPNRLPLTQHATPYSFRSPYPITYRVDWNGLFDLPKLKHLSFGELYNPAPAWIDDVTIRRDIEANHTYLTYMLPFFLERCKRLETLVVITNEDEMLEDIDEAFETFEKYSSSRASSTWTSRTALQGGYPFRFAHEAFSSSWREGEERQGTSSKRDPRFLVVPEFHPSRTLPEYWNGVSWGGADFWDLTEELGRVQRH